MGFLDWLNTAPRHQVGRLLIGSLVGFWVCILGAIAITLLVG